MACTADGAAPNWKFFKMHQQVGAKDGVVYKTTYVYSPERRPLYFISDVLHLIKTVRNCWVFTRGGGWVGSASRDGGGIPTFLGRPILLFFSA